MSDISKALFCGDCKYFQYTDRSKDIGRCNNERSWRYWDDDGIDCDADVCDEHVIENTKQEHLRKIENCIADINADEIAKQIRGDSLSKFCYNLRSAMHSLFSELVKEIDK